MNPGTWSTEYDPYLGWRSVLNYFRAGHFGPSKSLQINSQGFRASHDFTAEVPAGKIRAVCSGNSFTFGLEVTDEAAWCARLEALTPHLETLNMGQAGYGVDQMFIRYQLEGVKFKHNLHLFAFIFDDFLRMKNKEFWGKHKPILALKDGGLEAGNVPVPKDPLVVRKMKRSLAFVPQFRFYQFYAFVRQKISPGWKPHFKARRETESIQPIVLKLLDELKRMSEENKSTMVLVFLPKAQDVRVLESDSFRKWLLEEAKLRGIVFLDLVTEFRKINPKEIPAYFSVHYTEKGNRFAAQKIYEALHGEGLI